MFFLFIFLTRLPGILADYQLNPDESAVGAAVVTQGYRGFMPWVSFDTTTVGPVTTWLVALVSLFGISISFSALHVFAAVLWAASATLTLYILETFFARAGFKVGVLVLVATTFFTWVPDFLSLTSEAVPNLLLVIASTLLCVQITSAHKAATAPWVCCVVGLCSGLAVMGKLQALPPALFLCLFAGHSALQGRLGEAACSVGVSLFAAITPWLIVYVWLAAHGELMTAVSAYWLAGASYATASASVASWITNSAKWFGMGWWVLFPTWLLACVAIVPFVRYLLRDAEWTQICSKEALFVLGWFFSSLVAVITPSSKFMHHGVFLLSPSVLLVAGMLLVPARAAQWQDGAGKMCIPISSLFTKRKPYLALCCATWMAAMIVPAVAYDKWGFVQPYRYPTAAGLAVTEFVTQNTPEGQSILIWGWAPEIYMLSKRPSATRHIISHFLIKNTDSNSGHRETFLKDVWVSEPDLIVDATGPEFFGWWGKDDAVGLEETIPEIEGLLEEKYEVLEAGSVDHSLQKVKIWRKRSQDN